MRCPALLSAKKIFDTILLNPIRDYKQEKSVNIDARQEVGFSVETRPLLAFKTVFILAWPVVLQQTRTPPTSGFLHLLHQCPSARKPENESPSGIVQNSRGEDPSRLRGYSRSVITYGDLPMWN